VYFVALDPPGANLWRTTDGLASAALNPSHTTSCGDAVARIDVDPASPNRVGWVEPCVALAPELFQWSFTGDAGTSHDYVETPTLAPLRDVAAAPGAFLAVGDGGTIRRTFDGRVSDSIPAKAPLATESWSAVDYADRAHAAVGGAGGVLALSDDVDPRPTLVVGNGASARGSGGRVSVRIRGRLNIPAGISPATACQGKVFLTVKRGRRTLASRNATVRPSCRFSKTVTLPRGRVGGARRLTVVVRFGGNAQLGLRTKTLHVRVRR
jgi:hypothetical protein